VRCFRALFNEAISLTLTKDSVASIYNIGLQHFEIVESWFLFVSFVNALKRKLTRLKRTKRKRRRKKRKRREH
jgi:hypothetical protein